MEPSSREAGTPSGFTPAMQTAGSTTSSSSSTTTSSSSSSTTAPIDTSSGPVHRARRIWVQWQLGRSVTQLQAAGARLPGLLRLRDLDDGSWERQIDQGNRLMSRHLNQFSVTLAADGRDAKAARAVVMPLLLSQHKSTSRVLPAHSRVVVRPTPEGINTSLFDDLCLRSLGALDVRNNPANLAYVLSQLAPGALAADDEGVCAAMASVLERLVETLAAPSLGEAHARQLLDFAMRRGQEGAPPIWLAHAIRGVFAGYQGTQARWPQAVSFSAQMHGLLAQMSPQQLVALGRCGPPTVPMLSLLQPLTPVGMGHYVRGALQRGGGAVAGGQLQATHPEDPDDLEPKNSWVERMPEVLAPRALLGHALARDRDTLFACGCMLSRHFGEARAREVWEQVVVVAERSPAPDAAQVAAFERAVRLAWAPLTVLGEPGLDMLRKLRLLRMLDELVGVPLSARGWSQLAAIHGIGDVDANRPGALQRWIDEAIEVIELREAFGVKPPAASSVTTRRETKGDEADGDTADEA